MWCCAPCCGSIACAAGLTSRCGLFGFAIDVGLLYACDHFIDGFFIDSLLSAVLTALFINALCALFRK